VRKQSAVRLYLQHLRRNVALVAVDIGPRLQLAGQLVDRTFAQAGLIPPVTRKRRYRGYIRYNAHFMRVSCIARAATTRNITRYNRYIGLFVMLRLGVICRGFGFGAATRDPLK
jgi:hypothetical protein